MSANRARPRADSGLVRGDLPPWQRWLRYHLTRLFVGIVARSLFRIDLEGRDRLDGRPVLLCFNHLGWVDPFALITALPARPRLYFFGPREEDMAAGARNRIMWWSGMAVPFRPGKDDLLRTARHVQAVFDSGGCLAIAGEGAIHVHEGDLLPLQEGTAYFAIRAGIPIVPLAITGASWLHFRARVRVRVGEPIQTSGRPTRESVEAYTAATWHALRAMVDSDVDPPRPGRFGRWLTDLFNDWGPGGRDAASGIRGPRPEDVPQPALPLTTSRESRRTNPAELPAD
jgi:1-acyl-sn-glycerol-3-phosphate acyltransferase